MSSILNILKDIESNKIYKSQFNKEYFFARLVGFKFSTKELTFFTKRLKKRLEPEKEQY